MIKFINEYFLHEDDRGFIRGLLNFGTWEEINIIESESGIIRGNHYHTSTEELFIILEGKIGITLQKVVDGNLIEEVEEYEVKKDDVFLINKNINHIFEILEYSKWINVLTKKISKLNPDIMKVK